MKHFTLLCAALLFVWTYACKPAETKIEEPIASANFQVMVVKHAVKDFDTWKLHFDAHDSARVANGLTTRTVGRNVDDPNMTLVSMEVADLQKAKAFAAMPELKPLMDSAGVVGEPTIEYINVIRFDTATSSGNTRLVVSHKVKDFDAWLKVFDREGPSTRNSFGLADRGLGRGVDDPNIVYIVFAVTDIEKAKARAASEELKALMTEAGVEGAPDAFMYNVVQ